MIQLAQMQGPKQPMRGPTYQARVAPLKVEPTAMEKFKGALANKATDVAMKRGEEFAKPYLDSGMDKLKGMFASSTPAAAPAAAPLSPTALMSAGVDPGLAHAMGTQGAVTTGAATTGAATAGLTTAMPYIGMGLLAGKAFGLFNRGGPVYAEQGQFVGPLAIRKIKYKQDGGKIELEATMGE